MNLNLALKIIGSCVFVGGGIAGITTIVVLNKAAETPTTENNQNQENVNVPTQKQENENISIFVESTQLDGDIAEKSVFENNYQCEFGDEAFDCTITVPQIDETLKHSNIDKFTKTNETSDAVSKEKLKKSGNIYKLNLKNNTKISEYIKTTTNLISITPKNPDSKEQNAQFASLNILFTINGTKILDNTKTKNFIFKGESGKTTQEGSNVFKCSLQGTNNSFVDEICTIHIFGTENLTDNTKKELERWTFVKSKNNDKITIENNKYYLIKLNNHLTKAQKIQNLQIKRTNESKTNTYDVIPVISYEDLLGGSVAAEHLFILD